MISDNALVSGMIDGTDAPVASATAAALSVALGCEVDTLTRLGGHNPFRLSGEGRIWLVVEGSLDLFLTESVDAEAAASSDAGGRRRFVATVPEGLVCVGFTGDAPLAVPANGTRVCEASLDALLGLAAVDVMVPSLATVIAGWVCLLAGAAHTAPPATARVVRDAGVLPVAAGEQVRAASGGVLWAANRVGDIRVAEDATAPATGLRLALTDRAWLTAGAAGEWDLVATDAWLVEGSAVAALQWFQADALDRLKTRVALASAQDQARVRAAGADATGRFRSALLGLAGVLRPGARQDLAGRSTVPAIAAFQTAAEYLGVPPCTEASLAPALGARDPLLALSQRSGIALRKVELTENWWNDDHGALVTTLSDDGSVVVLLPEDDGYYRCIDPVSGDSVKIDSAVAATLDSSARVLYRPFPEGPLSPGAILWFGLSGSLREAAQVLALIVAVGIISMAVPVFSGWVLDPVIPQADTAQLLVLTVGLLIAGMTQQGFSLIQALYLLRMEGRVGNTVQSAVWDRLLKLPAGFFHRYSAGDLANRAMGIDAMRQELSGTTLNSITHGVTGIFSLGLMFYYDWRLACAAVLVIGIYVAIAVLAGRWVLRCNRELLRINGQLQGLLLQLLGAVAKLRVAGAERNAFARWAERYAKLQGITFDQQVLNNRLVVFRSVFSDLVMFLVILLLAWQSGALMAFYNTPQTWTDIDNSKLQALMPTAAFVPFNVALGQFMAAAFGVAATLVQLTNIPIYYERFAPILSARPESVNGADPGDVRGEIAVDAVTYRYSADGPLVLHGVSLTARPGEFVAVVGPSGAGKSSLVRLLLGFDTPESGSVFLDGRDIADLDKRLMRRNFGVVLQNGRLMAGTVYQNIVAGSQLSRDQAMEAARLAGLEADITAMPMGLDTYLSEGATTISGGQRQRLMIARAIVHRPKVLIFDEATSALDNLTQNIVTESLDAMNSTRIVIAHRLSTIIRADRLYVIDKGTVHETGTYESLMAQNGLFAAMARRQVI